MQSLKPGEVEVIVIESCSFNGPDHKSLGKLEPGDRVITHESYLRHLLDAGLVCMPEEFEALDTIEAEGNLADFDAELARQVALLEAGLGVADPNAETVEVEALPVNVIESDAAIEAVAVFADDAKQEPVAITATGKKAAKAR